jgi:hypothetical protein
VVADEVGSVLPAVGNAEVSHNLAGSLARAQQPSGYQPAASSAVTGAQGTYGLTSEATRMASAEQAMLPRAMQSSTREPVR